MSSGCSAKLEFACFLEVGEEAGGLDQPQDFLLVLMNPLQRKMLHKFGHDRVAVDTTYGGLPGAVLPPGGGYVYELTTLLVIDDYEEGFPVAFMCSSAIDTDSLREFFESIRTAVGEVFTLYVPRCFFEICPVTESELICF